MKVLGIDPGITATGYGILENGKVIDCGTIRPKRNENFIRISEICKEIEQLLDENKPNIAVLEKVFYQKNIQSLLRSSELRGAIILTFINSNIKIFEYTPAQIKLTTTGNGRASKKQVRYFIEKVIMKINRKISSHAIDALAIAYTATRKLRLKNNYYNLIEGIEK